ncbi:MAG: flavoprotein, partial [Spirochaetales bacterium]|nr:flavoprotein [Spirochaetales bacterium]
VYPASADVLARFRSGRAEDLLSALFLAQNFRSPWWIAPAMNSQMFAHPAVQENLRVLDQWGCRILPTEEGRMACGTYGSGKLLAPEAIRDEVKLWLKSRLADA